MCSEQPPSGLFLKSEQTYQSQVKTFWEQKLELFLFMKDEEGKSTGESCINLY